MNNLEYLTIHLISELNYTIYEQLYIISINKLKKKNTFNDKTENILLYLHEFLN